MSETADYITEFKHLVADFMAEYHMTYLGYCYVSRDAYYPLYTNGSMASILTSPKNYKASALLLEYNRSYDAQQVLKPQALENLSKTTQLDHLVFYCCKLDDNTDLIITAAADKNSDTGQLDFLFDHQWPYLLRLLMQKEGSHVLDTLKQHPQAIPALTAIATGINFILHRIKRLIKNNNKVNLRYSWRGKYITLTRGEIRCLKLVVLQISYKRIALSLNISTRTIEYHIKNIRDKTGCKNRQELFELAQENGLVTMVMQQCPEKTLQGIAELFKEEVELVA